VIGLDFNARCENVFCRFSLVFVCSRVRRSREIAEESTRPGINPIPVFSGNDLVRPTPQNNATDKPAFYRLLNQHLSSLVEGERDWLANAANACALLGNTLARVNWAGFYFYKGGELVVGPFQGKPACVRIALGKGVCGKSAADRATIIVPDVHQFPGHIACDAASQSEIVIPMIVDDRLLGVLDVDSPDLARFDHDDQKGLETFADVLVRSCIWNFPR